MKEYNPITISSSDKIKEIDNHFRVLAGPGAGKTYWLVTHIINVLQNSKRITPASKIACITYTTIASEQIKGSLKEAGDKVVVSTIHSFLYMNIVKPYAYLLKDENDNNLINFKELRRHEEHKPSIGKIRTWIEDSPKAEWRRYRRLIYEQETIDILSDLTWRITSSNDCILDFKKPRKFPRNLRECAIDYKKLYWNEGRMHHEDVLYFAYRILKENPLLNYFLSAKYPYIFIDEFQDTNPLQTIIIRWLANSGSTIGVIGDLAQSIYAFQGAKRSDFEEFKLHGQIEYVIEDNRRSTNNITSILNHIRRKDGLVQESLRKIDGEKVYVFNYGNIKDLIISFKNKAHDLGKEEICILARDNEKVVYLKGESEGSYNDVWRNIWIMDNDREIFLNAIFTALKYADQERYDTAFSEILELFKTTKDGELNSLILRGKFSSEIEKRGVALILLKDLIDNKEEILKNNLYELYNRVGVILADYNISIKGFRRGKIKEFFEGATVSHLLNNLKLSDDKDNIRTIHKSKGAEFESVLVYLGDESELKHILSPKIDSNDSSGEECRIYYVAASRAKDFLCFSVPSLSDKNERALAELGIKVTDI